MTVYLWVTALLAWTLAISRFIIAMATSATGDGTTENRTQVFFMVIKSLFWLAISLSGFYLIVQGV